MFGHLFECLETCGSLAFTVGYKITYTYTYNKFDKIVASKVIVVSSDPDPHGSLFSWHGGYESGFTLRNLNIGPVIAKIDNKKPD